MMEADKKHELVQIQLGPEKQAPQYWRSLDELKQTEQFERELHREFPEGAGVLDEVSRRGFMKLLGASAAIAGMAGCTKLPIEAIVPYVVQPEEIIPGKPLFFATNMDLGGYAQAILARSNEGRPTKIEGNPEHPISLGATDVFTQGALYDLYDPERAKTNNYLGEGRPWPDFIGGMQGPITSQRANGGAGLRVLTGAVGSPSLGAQLRGMAQTFPKMKWHTWEPVTRDGVRGGAQMAFGRQVETVYNLENADVVVALDADFLMGGFPGFTLYARQFGSRRDPDAARGMMRLYAIESTPSVTGFKADHRLPVKASQIEQYARALAGRLGVAGAGGQINGEHAAWLDALAKDLQAHRGAVVVIPGEYQPASVHALCHAINEAMGAVGKTVTYTEPVLENPVDMVASIKELVADMNAGKVEVLIILGGNPVFDAPADLDLKNAMYKVGLRIHQNVFANETTDLCHWFIAGTHFLEEWSDCRALNGMTSIRQPLIAPLYGGHSAHQVLAVFEGQPDVSDYDLVRAFWKTQYTGTDFEEFWRRSVHDGFMRGSEFKPLTVKANAGAIGAAVAPSNAGGLEIIYRHDPSIYDGRWANNAWLQECPKPLTKLTWENVVLLSPDTAKKMFGFEGSQHTKIVTLEHRGRKVNAPLWVQAGHPDDCVTVYFGYGRRRSGRTGSGKGFDAYQVRFTDSNLFGFGAKLTDTGNMYDLASTQGYQLLYGRNVVRAASQEEYKKDPEFAHLHTEAPAYDETLYPNYYYQSSGNSGNPEKQWERHGAAGYRWAMSIDLNSCVGCNACMIACQAENNVAVVGKEQVLRGRHMHWLRVDAYYEGDPANPRAYFEPLPCMQCEDAPCELVCPVGATVHSTEGLNDMVYNRCVGTRYCSNNCPWKVRRFNFMLWSDAAWSNPSLKMLQNPEVTVRSRGVMEKCTYCVQRITKARITSEEQDRRVRDGEILTACQEVCPSQAIIFGDLNDPDSKVNKVKQSQRNFGVLEELNTRPRTTYLAAVWNPNPAMPPLAAQQQPERNY
jgi:MoCo/4Fe-4S cofactor protein with predicted Tat translocation signal